MWNVELKLLEKFKLYFSRTVIEKAKMKEIKITNSKALGAEIRFSRKQQELTQMELSRLANTGVRFISDLENGKPDVSLSKLLSVVYALGLELRIVNKWSD